MHSIFVPSAPFDSVPSYDLARINSNVSGGCGQPVSVSDLSALHKSEKNWWRP